MTPTRSPLRGPRGLRIALATYLTVVALGLGGSAAHALWTLNGTVTSTVTAGTWGPTKVDSASVQCSRVDGDKLSDITVTWNGIDADGYRVSATAAGGGTVPAPQLITKPSASGAFSATLRLGWPDGSGRGSYEIRIAPVSAGTAGEPTIIKALLGHKIQVPIVDCTPLR